MVKKFKRPGAGDGDQLPSDLRPPHVLKITCDYLFRELLTNAPSLASVHGFIWDRTRAIRNDFSIQQVTKLEDVQIAIECFERIARFHILALHQMATPESRQQARKAEIIYDPQQEREQLDRTLLSLMQYYDDYRGRLELANEAEIRSYCVIFQLDSMQTDIEDRVQSWPRALLGDRRVQSAVQLYAAACTTFRRLGPFKALATEHVVARQDWESFWKLTKSTKISYLQACVAEIYFHLLRDMVLRSIVRAMRVSKAVNGRFNPSTDWSLHDLRNLFYFDDDEQLVAFCARYDLEFHQVGDEDYLDVSQVAGKTLQTPTFSKEIQESSWMVEQKRHGRSLAAVIDGMNVKQAHEAGMVYETDANEEMADVLVDQETNGSVEEDPESLFIPEVQEIGGKAAHIPGRTAAIGSVPASPFAPASGALGGITMPSNPSAFGQPSGGPPLSKPAIFGQTIPSTSVFSQPKPSETNEKKSTFNFLGTGTPEASLGTKTASKGAFAFPSMTSASLFGAEGSFSKTASLDGASEKSKSALFASPVGQSTASGTPSLFSPKQDTLPSPGLANPFKPATTDNPFLALAPAAPDIPQEKVSAPLFSFSKPEPVQNVPSLFGGLTPAVPPSISAPDETNSKPPAAQTQLTAPSQPPTITSGTSLHGGQDASGSTINPGSQSPPRRSSINNLPDTKPKKPSPLSHSFTFSEDSSSLGGTPQVSTLPAKQPADELFPGRQKTALPPSFTQTKPAAQSGTVNEKAVPDFDAVLTRISEELTIDPVSGFLKQYIDYTVKQVITKVQENLYWERMNSEADEFRSWFLQDKFGKRWRDTCRRQRLAKQGRERRKRAQKRLYESQRSDAHDYEDFRDAASTTRSSRMGSVASHQSKREIVDAMYKSTLGGSWFPSDRQAQAGSKRSVSSQGADSALPSAKNGHKRMKSTSHIDDGGRIGKPHASSTARSSFLNFSLATTAPNRSNTTKSPYFRMKALGVKPSGDSGLGVSRGTKRPRSESVDPEQRSRLSTSLPGSSPDQHGEGHAGFTRTPSTRSVRSKTNDDDEALFARLKAAREGLMESGSFMRSEVEKDSRLRRSASSLSDTASPSLARARAAIRMQTTEADVEFGASLSGRDIPAYRLRESRFVPRELYPHARERARERSSDLLASKCEPANKSRLEAEHFDLLPPQVGSFKAADAKPDHSQTLATTSGNSATSGLHSKLAPAVQTPGFDSGQFGGFDGVILATNAQSISQPINPAPNPFLDESWTQASQNPFLQAPVTSGSFLSQDQMNSFSAPAPQPSQDLGFSTPMSSAAHDNSIHSAQIGNALSRSFGQPAEPPQPHPSELFQATSKAVSSLSNGQGSKDELNHESGDHDSLSDESVQFNPNASANRFAMLVDTDDAEYESQESAPNGRGSPPRAGPDDEEQSDDEEANQELPDSYKYEDGVSEEYDSDQGEEFDGDDDDDQMAGRAAVNENEDFFSEEGGEDAEDEMEYDSDEGSYDDDEEDGRVFVPRAAFGYQQPQPNEALQIVGNNVEEAIELSD